MKIWDSVYIYLRNQFAASGSVNQQQQKRGYYEDALPSLLILNVFFLSHSFFKCVYFFLDVRFNTHIDKEMKGK